MPNRKLTDKYNYVIEREKKKIQYISTSQGCTNKCNFCSIWQIANGSYFHNRVDFSENVVEYEQINQLSKDKFMIMGIFGSSTKGN